MLSRLHGCYKKYRSSETALLRILNDVPMAMDQDSVLAPPENKKKRCICRTVSVVWTNNFRWLQDLRHNLRVRLIEVVPLRFPPCTDAYPYLRRGGWTHSVDCWGSGGPRLPCLSPCLSLEVKVWHPVSICPKYLVSSVDSSIISKSIFQTRSLV